MLLWADVSLTVDLLISLIISYKMYIVMSDSNVSM